MRAAIYKKFGAPEVIQIAELEEPMPKPDEVQVRVKAVAVTGGDVKARSLEGVDGLFWLPGRLMFGFSKPKNPIIGTYFSGVITQVGPKVDEFVEGDRVFGFRDHGACAVFMTIKANAVIAKLPDSIEFNTAAVAPFGISTAMTWLKNINLTSKSKVLINGASGGVGLAAIQLAKTYGAEVTGTCRTGKTELVKQAGADHVIDYKTQSLDSRRIAYDVILDTSGKLSFSNSKPLLNENGALYLIDFGGKDLLQMIWTCFFSKKKVKGFIAGDSKEVLEFAKKLILEGKFQPLVDKIFPLEKIVDAHRHFESGDKRGNIAVEILSI